jgi:phosphoenolpyruvate carboxykinase (ATP)
LLSKVEKNLKKALDEVISKHPNVMRNPERKKLIQLTLDNKEVILTKVGSLATWTRPESSGRSPKDTVIVKRDDGSGKNIDWDAPACIPISEETFDLAWNEALEILHPKERIIVADKSVGADSSYALPIRIVCPKAINQLFMDNMFRPIPPDIDKSVFKEEFTLLVIPDDKLDSTKYVGKLRKIGNKTTDMIIAVDFDRKLGLNVGSNYQGSNKKLIFTVMNYYLPSFGILPLHCSANEGDKNDVAILLGLSGTGKTTLSADPSRALFGDDEHGWSDSGIANFENGCYAKLIDLNPEKEPEIYKACFGERPYLEHGAIIENAMVYPDGNFDLFDPRFTENSRGSYPLKFLTNIKPSSKGDHPKNILFLTADAYGVIPPISKLTKEQAMLWFLMGYTSKLAGTEVGVTEPTADFSRFFGAPFMPRNPDDYAQLLGKRMEKHQTKIFLVNTGWSGGAYGVGERMDLSITRKLVNAALNGKFDDAEFDADELFHLMIPKKAPEGVPNDIMLPKNTWEDKDAYDETAKKLAKSFSDYFDKNFGGKVPDDIAKECPGK